MYVAGHINIAFSHCNDAPVKREKYEYIQTADMPGIIIKPCGDGWVIEN